MALSLNVELLADCYEASVLGVEHEWPPHPARAFCALVAAAALDDHDEVDALRWLERQGPPDVLVPEAIGRSAITAFVPTNTLIRKGGHQVYVGRTSGVRSRHRTAPASRSMRLAWTTADPPESTLRTLDRLARRVAYLGRATSPVLLGFTAEEAPTDGLEIHRPRDGGEVRLRVPYPGYLERLRDAHDGAEGAWTAARTAPYSGVPVGAPAVGMRSYPPAYSDVLVFAFEPGDGIDGRHAPAVARAFKAAVLQRLGEPRPELDPWQPLDEKGLALLHGHHDGLRRQCCFLALPFVGYPHATGQVLGVGIALSPDLDPEVRRAVLLLAGLDREDGQPRLDRLHVPGLGRRRRLTAPDGRATVEPARWKPSATVWTTALPIVLDWFPKRRVPPAEVVARGCEVAGYPRPASVDILPAPRVQGAPYVPPGTMRRRGGDVVRPIVHAQLTFDAPLTGPVLVGHLRHVGLGLCLPGEARR